MTRESFSARSDRLCRHGHYLMSALKTARPNKWQKNHGCKKEQGDYTPRRYFGSPSFMGMQCAFIPPRSVGRVPRQV